MYISEIKQTYPKLYEEILKRTHSPEYVLNGTYNTVNEVIIWSNTPQGQTFWRLVFEGHIEQAEQLYPELFITAEGNSVKEIQNGLFKTTI